MFLLIVDNSGRSRWWTFKNATFMIQQMLENRLIIINTVEAIYYLVILMSFARDGVFIKRTNVGFLNFLTSLIVVFYLYENKMLVIVKL